MDGRRLIGFLRAEGRAVGGIALIVTVVAILAVGGSRRLNLIPISYSAVANLIVAVVAVTSLYIAWRELVRKTEPNVTIDFDCEYPEEDGVNQRMALKLINSGANVVTPVNAWYGLVQRKEDGYYFTNADTRWFSEDGLRPGDTARLEIGDDVVMVQLKHINIRDWKGNGVSLDDIPREPQIRFDLIKPEGDQEIKIQEIFEAIMDVSRQCGALISDKEIRSSEVSDLIEEHNIEEELKIGFVD